MKAREMTLNANEAAAVQDMQASVTGPFVRFKGSVEAIAEYAKAACTYGVRIEEVDFSVLRGYVRDALINSEDEQKRRYERLRKVRNKIAREKDCAAYCICHNSALSQMAVKCPQTAEELLSIKGVGQKFVENYGDQFIQEISLLSE